jgi:hypothetical protein
VGSLCMAEPTSIYFKWRYLGLIPGFFFFSRPFLVGSLCMAEPTFVYFKWRCPRLIPGFYYYYYFPPLTDGPTQAIAF